MKRLSSVICLIALLGAMATFSSAAPLSAVRGKTFVTLVLHERNERELDALIAAQSDPDSPLFRHFLSEPQLADRYLPTAQEYLRTLALLRRAGFSIERTSPTRLIVELGGPESFVQRYFRTQNILATLPGVAGIATLDAGEPAPRWRAVRVRHPAPQSATLPKVLFGPDQGFAPYAIAQAMDFPVRHHYDGRNVTVGDLVEGNISIGNDRGIGTQNFSDARSIKTFLTQFGIARTGPATRFFGVLTAGTGAFDDATSVEDAQAVIGVAPGVKYQVYQFWTADLPYDQALLLELDNIVSMGQVDIVNLAFTSCELDFASTALLANEEFKAGTALGMTFIAPAQGGTYGGSHACNNEARPTVTFPADSPYVFAVGGADVRTNTNATITESPAGDNASNGGVSLLLPLPSYQKGLTNVLRGGRNLPDVALASQIDGVGASFYWSGIPGLVSPGWYGGIPFIDSSYVSGALAGVAEMHHGRLGLVGATLYDSFKRHGYEAASKSVPSLFTDITTGCNGTIATGAPSGPYCAAKGYDHVTGIGLPDLYALGLLLK